MSENTNTLFWVITGAVIVLAVFLLINNSQSNTLNKIDNKFDNLWKEVSEETNQETILYSSPRMMFGNNVDYNGANFYLEPLWDSGMGTVINMGINNYIGGMIDPLIYNIRFFDGMNNEIYAVRKTVDMPVEWYVTAGSQGPSEISYMASYWMIEIIEFERH